MIIPAPPSPVTLTYVGTGAGILSAFVRAMFACVPARFRRIRECGPPSALWALVIGGLYGLAVWVAALVGAVPEPGQLPPTSRDLLDVAVAMGGLGGFLGALVGLIAHYPLGHEEVEPRARSERYAGYAIVAVVAVFLLTPRLH